MRLALGQVNVVVGDLDGNVERLRAAVAEAQRAGADLVVLPELAVTGYPPEDLLLRPGFLRAAQTAVAAVAEACTSTVALVGAPALDRDLANAAFVCADGAVRGVYRKHFLPNYGVFDEHRYFAAGRELLLLELGDVLVGPTI
jgi:NAD+ synthase (glutamine-hydrolysing)